MQAETEAEAEAETKAINSQENIHIQQQQQFMRGRVNTVATNSDTGTGITTGPKRPVSKHNVKSIVSTSTSTAIPSKLRPKSKDNDNDHENKKLRAKGLSIAQTIAKQIREAKLRKIKQERQQRLHNGSGSHNTDPIFVVSLPGSGAHAISQYFQCDNQHEVAMHWVPTTTNSDEEEDYYYEIGRCMQNNIQNNQTVLSNCGQKATVYASIGYTSNTDQQCYFPNMEPTALQAIAKEYPKATLVQVTRDPTDWYQAVSKKWRQSVATHCRNSHPDAPIPNSNSPQQEWIDFYQWQQTMVRDFVKNHPNINYVEVSLDNPRAGHELQMQLDIPKDCWQAPPKPVKKPTPPKLLKVPYPIFVTSLPKSGTTSTQRYFQCGLNDVEAAAHHWTVNATTGKDMKIGKCMLRNIQNNKTLFDNCGDYQVWTDTGFMPEPNKPKPTTDDTDECFFPTLHEHGLEAFYQSYPNGTLLNVVRNATEWYQSAMAWRKLPERMAKHCRGKMPKPNAPKEDWVAFYNQHTQRIRDFAKQHPTLTFLEVSLEADDTADLLEESIGISANCWANCNPDKSKNKNCGVLRRMQEAVVEETVPTQEQLDASAKWRTAYASIKKQQREAVTGNNGIQFDWDLIHRKFDALKHTPVDIRNGKVSF